MKECFVCNVTKNLTEFYKHKGMSDGHLNKCKECSKTQENERRKELKKDNDWVVKERNRSREKYHKLGYRGKYKPTKEKKREIIQRYKEKYPEKAKAHRLCGLKPNKKGNNLHHWSYREEDAKDVLELNVKQHNLLHRHITYNQESKRYKLNEVELNSKLDHFLIVACAMIKEIL